MKKKLSIYYDEEGDFLELWLGEPPKEGYSKNLGEGIFEHVEEKTEETKGFAIHGFRAKTKNLKEITLPINTKKVEEITS